VTPLGSELRLRPAQQRDHAAYWRLFPELEATTLPRTEADWLEREQPRTIVAEAGELVVGLLLFEPLGHVSQLIVDPLWRRRGVGEQLLREAARVFRLRRLREWTINVKENNAPAIALYTKLGFHGMYSEYEVRLAWNKVGSLLTTPHPLTVFRVDPSGDAGLERAFALGNGRLDELRRRDPATVALAMKQRGGDTIGVAVFSPAFAHIPILHGPFEGVPATLIQQLRRYREPGDKSVIVNVRAEWLFDLLRPAMERTVLAVLHMRGLIP
jgi:GNAT superfamily N-acetyltransferase